MLCQAYSNEALSKNSISGISFPKWKNFRAGQPSTLRNDSLVAHMKDIIHTICHLTVQEVAEEAGWNVHCLMSCKFNRRFSDASISKTYTKALG
jgi:hypothetical protein